MSRPETEAMLLRAKQIDLVQSAIVGRRSASSSNLARSFGLNRAEVQSILRAKGVQDDD